MIILNFHNNTLSSAWARNRTVRSGVECTNREATALPTNVHHIRLNIVEVLDIEVMLDVGDWVVRCAF